MLNRPAVPRRRTTREPRRSFRPQWVHLEERTLLATVTWINPAGGDWDTAANWSSNAVPGSIDDAVIALPNITVTHNSGAGSVNSITSQDPIALNGGTLGIASASTINSSLTMSGGALVVSGKLSINALFALGDNSTISGIGTIDAYGGVTVISATLSGVTLNNHATATWRVNDGNGVGINLSSGAAIDNLAGATFTVVDFYGGAGIG
ncbi:MAG: hypothetical protein ACHRXM_40555, partial [Isosphaerales bacterium]